MNDPDVRPAAFFDLDGTIRRSKSGGFIDGPGDVELFPGVEAPLQELKGQGYLIFGVTNQGGVAYSHKTRGDVYAEIQAMSDLFDQDPFDTYFASPFHPGGSVEPWNQMSPSRKPKPGMLHWAEMWALERGYVIRWDGSFMVGDRSGDKECAENAGIDFEWARVYFNRES